MRIKVSELIGPRCITIEQAKLLFDQIHTNLRTGEDSIIDLTGVRSLVSLFLNHAVGALFKDFERVDIDSHLRFENASDAQRETIKQVMENSEKYHKDPNYRQAVDQVIARQFDEGAD